MPLFRRSKSAETEAPPQAEPEVIAEVDLPEHQRFGFVHELSPEFLEYMLKRYEQRRGKFVRVGETILVGPLKEGSGPDTTEPMHSEYIRMAMGSKNPHFRERLVGAQALAVASGGKILDEAGVKDAGKFDFRVGEDGKVDGFRVYGRSGTYHGGEMADPEDRARTTELAGERLGSGVEIIQDDHKF